MSGIYIHIPFCSQACHYCDFHFSTNQDTRPQMIDSLAKEIELRRDYLDESIKTIYFGGGTPSLLNGEELRKLLDVISGTFQVSSEPEITLEANPEDLTPDKTDVFKQLGINRLSIGVQTFADHALTWMNRIHNSTDTHSAYSNARSSGFENISLDLIYALPKLSNVEWQRDLEKITDLNPEHISIYGLTIEEKTVFGKWQSQNRLSELPEDEAAKQYDHLIKFLSSSGFRQYEVSNFSKPGYQSRHNGSYWSGEKYLGIGPGAHSFNIESRSFNVRNNSRYIRSISQNQLPSEVENLTRTQRMNEQILTGLRTVAGIDVVDFSNKYQVDLSKVYSKQLEAFYDQGLVESNGKIVTLTTKGFLVADEVALQLFFDE